MGVLIVGGGPAGVTTGYLLARAGIDVRIVERETDFERVFRGEGIMPSGMDALHEMGLTDLVNSLPTRVLESWDMYIDGQEIFSVPEPYEDLGERALRVIPQGQFLAGVVEEASKYSNFRFDFGCAFRDFIRKDGRVVGAVLESENGREDFKADLVIGCDGRGSLVRTRADLKLKLIPQSFDVLWFKLPAPEALRDHCSMHLMATASTVGACYTSWDSRLQYGLMIPKGAKVPTDNADFVEELCAPSPPWMQDHIRSVQDELDGPIRLKIMVGRCLEWSTPGTLLLGDAAHPMSPVRAQGINLALRDAVVAANHIVPAMNKVDVKSSIDDALAAIQEDREPEIKRAQYLQYQDTRFWGTKLGPFFVSLAKKVGPIMGKYQWAKNSWRNQQRDLWFGSREVKLKI